MTDIDIQLFPHTVEAFDDNEQRAIVFLDRYAAKNDKGAPVESLPGAMWGRVASTIAGDSPGMRSEQGREFFDLLSDFKFVPGGRILSGAGTQTEVTYYNCYVIPVETRERRHNNSDGLVGRYGPECSAVDRGNDSREAIIDTVGVMVDIMSRGGGVGINWSVLRPAGAHLKRINATSSGPIDWMHFASTAVGTVEQGGSRRGAAMFMLDDWHPDVLDFINSKRDLTRITNANISVCVSDEFMAAVKSDSMWSLLFPDTSFPAYDAEWDGDLDSWTLRGYPLVKYAEFPARDLWRKLAEAAWDNGEPGVVFLDRYNKQSTGKGVERIISVNPCGEQGLGAYSVCNLGAMNLAKYARSKQDGTFLWSEFARDVSTAVRFLDRVVDENYYFLPENEAIQKRLRRIGLGVMGLADALVILGMRYGSPEAVRFTENVFRHMKHAALLESSRLAREFGPAPAWDDSMLARPYLDDLNTEEFGSAVYEQVSEYGLRNLFVLTQAPTGTTSILAGVNSGIEPFFATGYWREDRTGKHWVEPKAIADHKAIDGYCDGSCNSIVTANEVSVEEHIAMQAAAQKYIDSSVSKTINAPNSHTVEDVEKAYTLAYKSGLKGVAYFRDGCGRAQVLSTEESKVDKAIPAIDPETGATYQWLYQDALATLDDVRADRDALAKQPGPYQRPEALTGRTHKTRAGTQTAYVTVNREVGDPDRPVEVFVSVGKSGTGMMEMGEAIGRLASIGLQKGLTLEDLIDQLDGVGNSGVLNRSLPSAIAAALRADIQAEAVADQKVQQWAVQATNVLRDSFYGQVPGLEAEEDYTVQQMDLSKDIKDVDIVVGVDLAGGSDKTVVVARTQETVWGSDLCPDCGSYSLVREEGCKKCHACGYSAC